MIDKIIEYLYLRQKNNLVYYDSMTGVKTRMYYDRVAKMKYLEIECYIIFTDIDCLKKINDTQGHHQGNLVIKSVAKKLLSLSNILDVCRIGGDEFIIFANKKFDVGSMNCVKQISYGWYLKDEYEEVSSAEIKADEFMYRRKQKRKQKKDQRKNKNEELYLQESAATNEEAEYK